MSKWTSSRGFDTWLFDAGKGFTSIFLARQGLQIGSCSFWDCRVILVTSLLVIASLIAMWWWCLNHLCHSVISMGRVEITITFSRLLLVLPSRKAELLLFISAMIHRLPFSWNSIFCNDIMTLKSLLCLRCNTDSKLFWIFGTCNTQCSSTVYPVLPLIHGLNKSDLTPSEYIMVSSASLIDIYSTW